MNRIDATGSRISAAIKALLAGLAIAGAMLAPVAAAATNPASGENIHTVAGSDDDWPW